MTTFRRRAPQKIGLSADGLDDNWVPRRPDPGTRGEVVNPPQHLRAQTSERILRPSSSQRVWLSRHKTANRIGAHGSGQFRMGS